MVAVTRQKSNKYILRTYMRDMADATPPPWFPKFAEELKGDIVRGINESIDKMCEDLKADIAGGINESTGKMCEDLKAGTVRGVNESTDKMYEDLSKEINGYIDKEINGIANDITEIKDALKNNWMLYDVYERFCALQSETTE